jgi:hypothetical protein
MQGQRREGFEGKREERGEEKKKGKDVLDYGWTVPPCIRLDRTKNKNHEYLKSWIQYKVNYITGSPGPRA